MESKHQSWMEFPLGRLPAFIYASILTAIISLSLLLYDSSLRYESSRNALVLIGYGILYLIGGLAVCIVFGFVTRYINESKGYTGGFAWGFWLNMIGVIVVACKPDNRAIFQPYTTKNLSSKDIPDKIKKLKELRDSNIISEADFQSKKEELLKRK